MTNARGLAFIIAIACAAAGCYETRRLADSSGPRERADDSVTPTNEPAHTPVHEPDDEPCVGCITDAGVRPLSIIDASMSDPPSDEPVIELDGGRVKPLLDASVVVLSDSGAPESWQGHEPKGNFDPALPSRDEIIFTDDLLGTLIVMDEDCDLWSFVFQTGQASVGGIVYLSLYTDWTDGKMPHRPGERLAYSVQVPLTSGGGFTEAYPDTPVHLTAGTVYWIVVKAFESEGDDVRIRMYPSTMLGDWTTRWSLATHDFALGFPPMIYPPTDWVAGELGLFITVF